jgi:hypothetical protein
MEVSEEGIMIRSIIIVAIIAIAVIVAISLLPGKPVGSASESAHVLQVGG